MRYKFFLEYLNLRPSSAPKYGFGSGNREEMYSGE
jgi:hypothetical protein